MTGQGILLVDDEEDIRYAVRSFLETKGYVVTEAGSCAAALEAAGGARHDAVIIDYMLPDGTALDLLPKLRELDASMPMVVLTGHGSIDLAVAAIKEGADQFLTKPIALPALLVVVERLLKAERNNRRQLARTPRTGRGAVDPFLGGSAVIQRMREEAERIAGAEAPVLVLGETGSGKGVLARWLHSHSPRRDEALVDLNCAGLSNELLDAELFGHEKGAFTGAVAVKVGLLEVAHHGTLFLDEIGDMAPTVQAKLLKVLEEQRFRRVGDVRDRQVNVRLIAATHQDVPKLVQDGRFRRDLYFRINTLPLSMPALRERSEDIPVLAADILDRLSPDLGRRVELAPDAMEALASYSWPGNVRELRNVLERALLLSDTPVLRRQDLRFESLGSASPSGSAAGDLSLSLRDVERQHIERVMADEAGRVDTAAKRLGISRSTLYQKVKEYGLSRSGIRSE